MRQGRAKRGGYLCSYIPLFAPKTNADDYLDRAVALARRLTHIIQHHHAVGVRCGRYKGEAAFARDARDAREDRLSRAQQHGMDPEPIAVDQVKRDKCRDDVCTGAFAKRGRFFATSHRKNDS